MIMFSEYLRQRSFLNMETTLEAGENTAKNQQQRKLQQAPLPMLRKPGKHELPKKAQPGKLRQKNNDGLGPEILKKQDMAALLF